MSQRRCCRCAELLGMLAICIALLLGCAREKEAERQPATPSHVAEVLSWLPEDIETVIVVNEPRSLSTDADWERLTPIEACSWVANVALPNKGNLLKNVTAQWSVTAMRNFRPAGGIGLCPFDGLIVVGAEGAALQEAMEEVAKVAKKALVGQQEALVFVHDQVSDVWTYYFVLMDDKLVVATDEQFLLETLEGMAAPRMEPPHTKLPLWPTIDPTSPFWAVRRFTEQANKLGYGMNLADSQLRAYALQMNAAGTELNWRQNTDSPDGNEIARSQWSQMDTQKPTKPKFSEVDGDLVMAFGEETDWVSLAFYLTAALGPAVFL